MNAGEARRLAHLIAGVVGEAVRESGARGVVVLDDGSPEARLLCAWLGTGLREGELLVVDRERAAPVAQALADACGPQAGLDDEALRALARGFALRGDLLVANSSNKTTLLLDGPLPPDPLLPLGDLYASEVAAVAGACTVPEAAERLAAAAGGIQVVDRALWRYLERREPPDAAFAALEPALAAELRALLARGCWSRVYGRVVPKLGERTLGVDLKL